MAMTDAYLCLDPGRRSVTVGARETVLQEKCWQVLLMIRDRAPQVVGRDELIDALWAGNSLTGDKGVNQAIWTLRKALGDDNRNPRFIRTVPRRGYRWIHSNEATTATGRSRTGTRYGLAAAIAASAALMLALPVVRNDAPADGKSDTRPELVAVKAYVVNRDIHVEFQNGCRGILKSRENAVVRSPVLSLDGARVALTLGTGESCRLVTVDLNSLDRQEYGFCPSEII